MPIQSSKHTRPIELLFWSIAFPGFGQLLNARYVKGILFIILEVVVNVNGHFNTIIVLSYHGDTHQAVAETNYLWLMFYPCLYFFSMWDAYRDAGGGEKPYASVPFVFAAYFVTLGLIFSPSLRIFGVLLGPMWLPILFLPLGIVIGFGVKAILAKGIQ